MTSALDIFRSETGQISQMDGHRTKRRRLSSSQQILLAPVDGTKSCLEDIEYISSPGNAQALGRGSSKIYDYDVLYGLTNLPGPHGVPQCQSVHITGAEGQSNQPVSSAIGNVCFGMLVMPFVVSKRQERVVPYTKICFNHSGEQAQLLIDSHVVGNLTAPNAHVISCLQAEALLTLQAYINTNKKPHTKALQEAPHMSVCVILYGPSNLSRDLGEFLDKCDIYLQDPLHCDFNVEYHNPQRLYSPLDQGCTTSQLAHIFDDRSQVYEDLTDILSNFNAREDLEEYPNPSVLRTTLFRQVDPMSIHMTL